MPRPKHGVISRQDSESTTKRPTPVVDAVAAIGAVLAGAGNDAPRRFAPAPVPAPLDVSLADWRELVIRAIARTGWHHKRVAAEMGINPAQLSRQLAYDGQGATDHLSFWRMASLPTEFWKELIHLIAEFHRIPLGTTQQDLEDCAVGRLMREAVQRVRNSEGRTTGIRP